MTCKNLALCNEALKETGGCPGAGEGTFGTEPDLISGSSQTIVCLDWDVVLPCPCFIGDQEAPYKACPEKCTRGF